MKEFLQLIFFFSENISLEGVVSDKQNNHTKNQCMYFMYCMYVCMYAEDVHNYAFFYRCLIINLCGRRKR